MTSIESLYTKVFTTKRWRNVSNFCDGIYHPVTTSGYRRYRRGKTRCLYCGSKLGEIHPLKRTSPREDLIDSVYSSKPLFSMLRKV